MSHVFPTYQRWSLTPSQAEGSWITMENGKKYLDFTSGIGVLNLGHRHPKVEEAVKGQLEKYWHTSNLFEQPLQEQLAGLLAASSGLDAVFFSNSGAEANEAAIKLAKKATGRKKIVTCLQSFHGRTYAGMGATGQEKVKTGFGPMLDAFEYVPFNDRSQLQDAVDEDTAAIMVEAVQGEGGIHCATLEYLKAVQETARKAGALLIIDEVQTGIGRTGEMFAFQHYEIEPDIITLAKGLGNGLPIGAMLGTKELAGHFGPGSHGSTFGGNPLSTASSIAVMQEMNSPDFLEEVKEKGKELQKKLKEELKNAACVKEVRGLGLMIGIELALDAAPIIKNLQDNQLLVLNAGPNVIRLMPPLTVSDDEIGQALEKLVDALSKTAITAG